MASFSLPLTREATFQAEHRLRAYGDRAIDIALEEYAALPADDRRRPLLNRVIAALSFKDVLIH